MSGRCDNKSDDEDGSSAEASGVGEAETEREETPPAAASDDPMFAETDRELVVEEVEANRLTARLRSSETSRMGSNAVEVE